MQNLLAETDNNIDNIQLTRFEILHVPHVPKNVHFETNVTAIEYNVRNYIHSHIRN